MICQWANHCDHMLVFANCDSNYPLGEVPGRKWGQAFVGLGDVLVSGMWRT